MAEPLFVFDRERLHTLFGGSDPAIATPAFVYDLDHAADRFGALREVLPARVHLAYAVKSNPGAPLLATFARLGAWFDCASAGEVEQVLAASPRAGVVFAGPAKSDHDLATALDAGARIQVDGIEDVQRIDAEQRRRAGGTAPPVAVSVRVNPTSGMSERASIIGGGGPSAFGVDEEDLETFLSAAGGYPAVRITGLQVFAASNELEAAALLANHATALGIASRLHHDHGLEMELVDVGGGLGIRYADSELEDDLDIAAVGQGLRDLLAEHPWFTGRLLLEPGRWLSGPCGVYAAKVVRTKVSRGVRFAMLEGGINHLLRPLMTGQSFPTQAIRDATQPSTSAPVEFTLAGPLCTSLDRLGVGILPADLTAGDVVVFGQSGAYAYTQAMTHFLSHPPPAQHWLPAAPSCECSGECNTGEAESVAGQYP